MYWKEFKRLDSIKSYLIRNGSIDDCTVKYVERQLQTYKTLLDKENIHPSDIGAFYWGCRARIREVDVSPSAIDRGKLPPETKNLYHFLANPGDPESAGARAGESYFFHGTASKNEPLAVAGSASEYFLIARHYIDQHYQDRDLSNKGRFRKAVVLATMYDHIHNSSDISEYSTDIVCRKTKNLCQWVDSDEILDLLITHLHDPRQLSATRRRVDHLGFLYRSSPNYTAAKEFLEGYFSDRQKNCHFISTSDISPTKENTVFREQQRICVAKIRGLGLRSFAFTTIVQMRTHLNRNVDESSVTSLSILFAYSPAECYLTELLRGRSTQILVPHGLPQLASYPPDTFDHVLSLTKPDDWQAAFPGSHILHTGWVEGLNFLSRESQTTSPVQTADKDSTDPRKVVLFLSQLTGARVHQLRDFEDVTFFFMRESLELPKDKYVIDIRLRNEDELELIPQALKAHFEAQENCRFSFASEQPIYMAYMDILVGATSTGLLYSQVRQVPLLVLTTRRLQRHWPFDITDKDRIWILEQTKGSFVDYLEEISRLGARPLSGRPVMPQIYKELDSIYDESERRFGHPQHPGKTDINQIERS